ncbi:alpha/beta fold hydrolase [Ekhidna sp.]|uniref:alpha/beta fold hydrolase n=1 Tax=Ekhidna sp. TaxID=2608089 RepID=UPI003B58E85C
MKKLGLTLVFITSISVSLAQQEVEVNGIKGQSNYLETDWGKVYYEVYGEGDPLLILHGNGGSIKGKHHLIPELAKNFTVIGMDSRCHGKSDCTEDDLDYFEMADDVYALMEALGYEKYMIWGHSDGGILGLILGYKYTERIDRMVLSGANAYVDGLKPELVQMMNVYEQIPDPRMKKHLKLMVTQKPIPMDSLAGVEVPVMLMVGDRDAVKMEHTMEIFNALPQSNLCVLPGTSHFLGHEKSEQLIYWINQFKQPFKASSTVEIAKQMAKSMLPDE